MPVAIWVVEPLFEGGALYDPWFSPGLIINLCFALIFAAVGALGARMLRGQW